VYSQNPSLTILDNIAQSIAEILKRNLDVSTSKKTELIEKVIAQNIKRKNFLISTIDMAKKLSIDSKELNSFCVSKYSMSYAKFMLRGRMLSALKMLEEGMSVVKVSSALAYANPYVFSRSFKKYFGYPPSERAKMNIK
jgi:AraC-like DNA-binding protein